MNIIHVTGTKGKGSTCAFTQSILQQYQPSLIKKIGLYTSPHLKSVCERISIDGKPINEQLFAKYFFEIWDKLSTTKSDVNEFPTLSENEKPAYFKYLTLLSFYIFLKEGVDTAIYEVGVGGELDSTNIIHKPTVTGVSALGIDHTFMLGSTLKEIAWNKGGIFKNGAKAFSVNQPKEGLDELKVRAKEKDTTLTIVEQNPLLDNIRLGISGDFQKSNASLAIELSKEHLNKLNIKIDSNNGTLPKEFIKGLENANWPGRCQTIIEGNINWYIDGAHTRESIIASTNWFKTITSKNITHRILLFNQQTRDANSLINHLNGVLQPEDIKFTEAIFTTNKTFSNGAYKPDLLSLNTSKEQVDDLTIQKDLKENWNKNIDSNTKTFIFKDIEDSINLIRKLSNDVKNEENGIENVIDVFVTGSLHLVGGVLVVLDK